MTIKLTHIRMMIAALFLIGCCLHLGCTTTGTSKTTKKTGTTFQNVRETAPTFSLQDTKGNTHNLSQYKGKIVLLNFWATWCEPCKKEFPHFQRFLKKYGPKGFVVLAVSIDDAKAKSTVGPTVYRYGYNFTVLLDSERRVISLYSPKQLCPYSVLIDRKGQTRWKHESYQPGDEKVMEKKIIHLLKE